MTIEGIEGEIAVVAFGHSIEGSKHGDIVITKSIDNITPLLYKALVNNETLRSVQINFLKDGSSSTDPYFEIRLLDARITRIGQVTQMLSAADTLKFGEFESVSFTYENINWRHPEGMTEYQTKRSKIEEKSGF